MQDRGWADAFFVSASVSKIDKEIQTGATQDRVIGMAERNTQSLNVAARYEKADFLTEGMQFQASVSHTWDHSQTIVTAAMISRLAVLRLIRPAWCFNSIPIW